MKGVYVVDSNYFGKSLGVQRKIDYQISVFKKNNLEIELLKCSKPMLGDSLLVKLINYATYNLSILPFRIYPKDLNVSELDFVYVRYMNIDNEFLFFIEKIKHINPNCKILMEIPTYPIDKYKKINPLHFIKKNQEKNKVKLLSNFIDAIVTYSDDEKIFNIDTVRISNGVDTNEVKLKTINSIDINEVHIIAVAKFNYWHGYDRFLEGLKNYYKNDPKVNVILHIVGDGPALKKYKKIVNKNSLYDYVVFHGTLTGSELDFVYNQCDLALDAMGRHRSGTYYNSSLKGKEYMAKGLPIVSGVKTELDLIDDYKYYKRVLADESPINISDIVDFYNEIYSQESKKEISERIRKEAETHFNIDISFKPVIKFISNK